MSEKKRARRRKDEYAEPGEKQLVKPSKDEIKLAKWMKKNVKTKKTKFLSHNVEYFTSSKAIDALLKSKFAQGANALFSNREQVIEFLDIMLEHKFFHRAKKVPVTLEELRSSSTNKDKKDKDDKTTIKEDKNQSSSKKDKDKKTKDKDKDGSKKTTEDDDKKDTDADASGANGAGAADATDKKEKRKRKIRLDMHPEQIFVDGSEAYVWIYDPIPIHYWIYGLILLLGAIGICLFPLWPSMLRKGVYYLSMAAAGFLVFILALTVIRLIVFTIVWAITGSKLHFWIFPNLTEDVGFFASFWPLYESKYVSDAGKTKADKRAKALKSKKKDKDSDAEDETVADDGTTLEPEKIEEIKEHDADIELRHRNVNNVDADVAAAGDNNSNKADTDSSGADNSDVAADSDAKGTPTPSESESEISGKDYEIISSSEVQNVN